MHQAQGPGPATGPSGCDALNNGAAATDAAGTMHRNANVTKEAWVTCAGAVPKCARGTWAALGVILFGAACSNVPLTCCFIVWRRVRPGRPSGFSSCWLSAGAADAPRRSRGCRSPPARPRAVGASGCTAEAATRCALTDTPRGPRQVGCSGAKWSLFAVSRRVSGACQSSVFAPAASGFFVWVAPVFMTCAARACAAARRRGLRWFPYRASGDDHEQAVARSEPGAAWRNGAGGMGLCQCAESHPMNVRLGDEPRISQPDFLRHMICSAVRTFVATRSCWCLAKHTRCRE